MPVSTVIDERKGRPTLRCSGSSWPSAPSSPTAMGIGTGPFSAWPGVGGVLWLARTVYVRPAASYSVATRTCGVPAWPYLRGRSQGRLEPLVESDWVMRSARRARDSTATAHVFITLDAWTVLNATAFGNDAPPRLISPHDWHVVHDATSNVSLKTGYNLLKALACFATHHGRISFIRQQSRGISTYQ